MNIGLPSPLQIYTIANIIFNAGLSEVTREIELDHSLKPVNSLCSLKDSLRFFCFEPAQPLQSTLNRYHMLSHLYSNDFFKIIWTSVLKKESKSNTTMTFTDILRRVWDPVFERCCQLIDGVQARSIKLRDVDRYFGKCEGSKYIREHLFYLHSGIEACNDRTVGKSGWIQVSVDLMQQYWAICEQAEAAAIILELKERLNLTGSFEIIENVASQVTESMKDLSLDSIDCKLIEAKSFLERVTADSKKLECLREFASCSSIVKWIRKETTGEYNMPYFALLYLFILKL